MTFNFELIRVLFYEIYRVHQILIHASKFHVGLPNVVCPSKLIRLNCFDKYRFHANIPGCITLYMVYPLCVCFIEMLAKDSQILHQKEMHVSFKI